MIHKDTNIDIASLATGMVTKDRKRLMGYGSPWSTWVDPNLDYGS
jgi:hypothetical protein